MFGIFGYQIPPDLLFNIKKKTAGSVIYIKKDWCNMYIMFGVKGYF